MPPRYTHKLASVRGSTGGGALFPSRAIALARCLDVIGYPVSAPCPPIGPGILLVPVLINTFLPSLSVSGVVLQIIGQTTVFNYPCAPNPTTPHAVDGASETFEFFTSF